jgi:hypothetical protein
MRSASEVAEIRKLRRQLQRLVDADRVRLAAALIVVLGSVEETAG